MGGQESPRELSLSVLPQLPPTFSTALPRPRAPHFQHGPGRSPQYPCKRATLGTVRCPEAYTSPCRSWTSGTSWHPSPSPGSPFLLSPGEQNAKAMPREYRGPRGWLADAGPGRRRGGSVATWPPATLQYLTLLSLHGLLWGHVSKWMRKCFENCPAWHKYRNEIWACFSYHISLSCVSASKSALLVNALMTFTPVASSLRPHNRRGVTEKAY